MPVQVVPDEESAGPQLRNPAAVDLACYDSTV